LLKNTQHKTPDATFLIIGECSYTALRGHALLLRY